MECVVVIVVAFGMLLPLLFACDGGGNARKADKMRDENIEYMYSRRRRRLCIFIHFSRLQQKKRYNPPFCPYTCVIARREKEWKMNEE